MLRQPFRRNFTTFHRQRLSRPPPRHTQQQQYPDGTPFTYQRVRFRRPPFFTWRRLVNAAVYTLPFYLLFKYSPIGISVQIDDGAETLGPDGAEVAREGEAEEEFEGEEDATFIPFSWPKEEERTFYRGSDPEWQEFLKLAKDQKRHREIHSRLALKVRSEVAGHPQAPRIMGKIDQNKGRFWLDTQFPAGPPRAITVTGIEIGTEYIAWVTKEIDQEQFSYLKRTILPVAAFWGSWETGKYLAKLKYHQAREYLGLPPLWQLKRAGPKSTNVDPKDNPMSPSTPQAGPMSSSTAPTAQGLAGDINAAKAAAASAQPDPHKGIGSSQSSSQGLPKDMLPISASGSSIAFFVFMNAMRRNIGPQKLEAPRGCAVMSGLVEVLGDKGKAVIDVTAAYDPKKDEFVVSGWFPRRIQPRRQHPRGGP